MAYGRIAASGGVGSGSGPVEPNQVAFGTVTIPVTNLKFPAAYSIGITSGDTDLYTVPAGKKALLIDVIFTNPAGNSSSISCDAEVKISGVYHKFDFVTLGASVGTYGGTNAVAPFLLAAGETFAVNASAAGLSVWPAILEFDATVPIFDARLLSLSAGNNTVFTVPANVTIAFAGFPAVGFFYGPYPGRAWYFNASLADRTIQINAIPSGGSPANANAFFSTVVTNHQMAQPLFYGGLAPGDFVNINTDASTVSQIAWVIYTTQ